MFKEMFKSIFCLILFASPALAAPLPAETADKAVKSFLAAKEAAATAADAPEGAVSAGHAVADIDGDGADILA